MTTTQTFAPGNIILVGIQSRKATVLAATALEGGEWMLKIETTDSFGFRCERDLWVGADSIVELIG